MLFLLLVYSLIQSNPGDASPIPSIQPRADASCNDLNHCRTIWDIIWSCFSTIILCTWVTLHPNISISRDTRGMGWFKGSVVYPLRSFMKNKFPLVLCGLLAPEYILGWAIRQHLMAREIQQKVPGWTRTHGFFMIMGGYHLYRLPHAALSTRYPPQFNLPTDFDIVHPLTPHSREEEVAEHPLKFTDLSVRALAYLAPSKTEIMDKGKADVLVKVIALAQTMWFVAQCVARGVERLPLTELEVVTLAYPTMSLFTYCFWWDKPKGVECPVRVYKTAEAGQVKSTKNLEWNNGAAGIVGGIVDRSVNYIGGAQDHYFRLSGGVQVPMFWSGKPAYTVVLQAMLWFSIFGIAFGGVHFIAWDSEFPSHIELLVWRVSCITITAVPLTVAVSAGGQLMKLDQSKWGMGIATLFNFSAPLAVSLYLFTRIATLVVAFATLRALPLDAMKTVDWTTFVPHL